MKEKIKKRISCLGVQGLYTYISVVNVFNLKAPLSSLIFLILISVIKAKFYSRYHFVINSR